MPMPKIPAGLTVLKVKTAGPGRYADGDGLYLLVRPTGARFWILRYRVAGPPRGVTVPRSVRARANP
jgi:hypothetical protein